MVHLVTSGASHRVTFIGAAAFAAVGSVGLRAAVDRSDAAWIVAVAWAWGAWVAARSVGGAPGAVPTLAAAAALRLLFIGVPLHLSDDVYRYLFEGLAVRAGHDPLLASPASLAHLAPELADQVNHNQVSSVYPPLAMVWFVALSVMGGTPLVAQLATASADLLTVAALHRVRPSAGWLYALLPLPVLESAAGAHIDVPAVALAAVGIALVGRPGPAFAAIAAGAAVKLFPAVLLPEAARRLSPRGRAAAVAIGLIAAAAALARYGGAPAGVRTYGAHWSFNGMLWPWLHPVFGDAARWLLLALGGAAFVATSWRRRPPAEVWFVMGATFVATSPTLHPWYGLWALVPALATGRFGWAAASTALLSGYWVLSSWDASAGAWTVHPWLWWVTWVPFLVAALGPWARRRDPA